jgi:RNA polymerase sigma-70 factor (ECF subfamily)
MPRASRTPRHSRIPGRNASVKEGTRRPAVSTEGPLSAAEEQALLQKLLVGDEEAIRTIYARFARPVYSLGLRLLGGAEAAEELTQDVFLTAWRKAARFDASRGRLSTWLMAIAHNLAVDRLRRENGAARPTLVFVEEVPERYTEGEVEPVIERDSARRAMESLSDGERRLLVRAYFDGHTAREIAEADHIPLGTVKTRLRTALIKIRRATEGKEL